MEDKTTHGKHKNAVIQGEGVVSDNTDGFQFTRIFKNLSPFVVKMSVARTVGLSMTSPDIERTDSNIPAGYTYFGQFVDHDITRDVTGEIIGNNERDNPNTDAIEQTLDSDLVQMRSPSLDLDSVYGIPTKNGGHSPRSDGLRFDFALTQSSQGAGHSSKTIAYDFQRGTTLTEAGESKPVVLIPDNRNDENLVVAQMHASWMRFHNKICDVLEAADPTASTIELFEKAKFLTIRHYQHIVLHDFLKRVCDEETYNDVVIDKKCKHFTCTAAEIPAMPLEFSVAAYRFGHTLVREDYNWNLNFSEDGQFGVKANFNRPSGQLQDLSLFAFTTTSGMLTKQNPLPSNWIVDWRRMFDFSDTDDFDDQGVTPQMTKAIDPYISSGMRNIPGEMNNLATANIRRSGLRGLPTGQDVSREMSAVKMLTAKEMTQGLDDELKTLVEDFEFAKKAPLWFYILQEGSVRSNGNNLGEMGSTLLCETFMGLVNSSRPSILQENWSPDTSPLRMPNGDVIDSVSKMLAFVDNVEPIINPLEDMRL